MESCWLTKEKDIIRIKVPFPNIEGKLATMAHMYLCIESGVNKKIVSCQTKKPHLLNKNHPPYKLVEVEAPSASNPFSRPTIIACDYAFSLSKVKIAPSMLTIKRRNISDEIYDKVLIEIAHKEFHIKVINKHELLSINPVLS